MTFVMPVQKEQGAKFDWRKVGNGGVTFAVKLNKNILLFCFLKFFKGKNLNINFRETYSVHHSIVTRLPNHW